MKTARRPMALWVPVGVIMAAVGVWSLSLASRDSGGEGKIALEKVAEYLHAVIEADRTIYTTQVVDRMQEKGITSAVEHWEQQNALPLPAQFLQSAGRLAAERGSGIRYRLISLWPIYQRNGPATEFERKGLEAVISHPERPFTGTVTSGQKQFFQAIYADKAVTKVCVSCHNSHPLSPKRDFKLSEVMGGIVITIPLPQ